MSAIAIDWGMADRELVDFGEVWRASLPAEDDRIVVPAGGYRGRLELLELDGPRLRPTWRVQDGPYAGSRFRSDGWKLSDADRLRWIGALVREFGVDPRELEDADDIIRVMECLMQSVLDKTRQSAPCRDQQGSENG